MEFLIQAFFNVIPFLIVITVLVFVHEYGHYITALKNGVKVDIFSIGFGPEIFGWTNARGMRWKISAVPLGGYIKLADEDAQFKDNVDNIPAEQLQYGSLITKTVGQKMAISFAGPLANFIYAIVVMAGLYTTVGQRVPLDGAQIGQVMPGSVAEASGLKSGDQVLTANGETVHSIKQLGDLIRIHANQDLNLEVKSVNETKTHRLSVKPTGEPEHGKLGVEMKSPFQSKRHNLLASLYYATLDTMKMCQQMLIGIGHMLMGKQSASGLSGPIGIASMTGQIAQQGIIELLFLSTILSINLGLLNLFPIPVLDGGHLVLYAIEGIRGKPVPEKMQENIFKVGFLLMIFLFAFTFWNDLQGLKLIQWIKSFF